MGSFRYHVRARNPSAMEVHQRNPGDKKASIVWFPGGLHSTVGEMRGCNIIFTHAMG